MAKKITESSDSSLSPAPENLAAPVETEVPVKAATNGRKRKAEATVTTTAKTTKRAKNATVEEIKEEDHVIADIVETPLKKRTATKKVNYEEDVDADAVGATTTKKTVVKKTVRAKKSKEPVPPLEARTVDTKLRIGAHVSVAGG
jgi:AP endonuclease-1